MGPFKVIEKHGSSCVLDLPTTMNIHQTFHVSLLRKDPGNPLPGQQIEPPPPIIIDGEQEWEVKEILESRRYRNQLQYRARWTGYEDTQQWWPARDFKNAPEKIQEFHNRFPEAVK